MKTGFFYARIDLDVLDHPKAFIAGVDGFGLWAWSVCYSRKHLTNGEVPEAAILAALGGKSNAKLIEKLIACGLWSRKDEQTIVVVNYSSKNETREDVEERKEWERQRKRKARSDKSGFFPASVPPNVPRDRARTEHGTTSGCPTQCPTDVPISIYISDLNSSEGVHGEIHDLTKAEQLANRESLYRDAYQRGISKGKNGDFAMNVFQQGELNLAIQAHAKSSRPERLGQRLRGDDLLGWIEAAAKDFATWVMQEPNERIKFYSSFEPRGFRRFLNEQTNDNDAREVG